AGIIEPALAESWNVSSDGLTWTFNLRDDVQWVDLNPESGDFAPVRPVTAGDVVFAVQRACHPDRPSPLNTNLYIIAGCRTLATSNTINPLPSETVQVRAIDDTTLEIQLLYPAGYFLTITSLPEMRPLPPEYINDSLGNWPRPGATPTSGAWIIENWSPGSFMRLVKNPFWQGDFVGNLDAITLRFDVPLDSLATEISNGSPDLARIEANIADSLQASSAEILYSSPGSTVILLGFAFNNTSAEGLPVASPLDSPFVRQALALSLDRPALAQAVFGSSASPADHMTPRSAMAAPSVPGAAFDAAAALRALNQAGYAGCNDLGVLTLAVSNDAQELLLAQNMVTQWQNNLGCSFDNFPIVQTSRTAILDSAHKTVDVLEASPFPLWIITWSADYPDAQNWVSDTLHCDYGYFRVGRVCDRVDTFMDQAALSTDVTSRFTAYNQIETDLFGAQGSFPVVPLAVDQNWWAQQPWLTGVGSYGAYQFDRWILEREN
ncbi:MAG TPA: ABC transporter substrate-binding protein, partial [Aggregatilineales bacterium]|nr:ABC transporter substrate-binding protein [Aggregatilineales bacterium]